MNRKHLAFKCVNKWLEKYYKSVNTGIIMGIKNLKNLEVKFVKEKDFNKDRELNDDINIDISDSEKSTYNLENFVVNNSVKNYYCPDCKEYCYSEFHIC
ncbi:1728_t:CDS:2, partial [Gigaspora margarita]